MSENDKDNRNFEFIKEQVIEKKRRKIKKWLLPLLMTIFLAILFGMIAAVTFVITEPRLYELLHKEEVTKTPVSFPTKQPEEGSQSTSTTEDTDTATTEEKDPEEETDPNSEEEVEDPHAIPDTVYVEQSIDADLDDLVSISDDIRRVAYEVNKSVVNITSTVKVTDWFSTSAEKTIHTTGVIIHNNSKELLILVSLDRVKDANSLKIVFSDTTMVDAVLQDYESEINQAVISVAIEDIPDMFISGLQVANLGESYTVTVGSPIIALGNPNGHPKSMDYGIVTSRESWASVTDNKLDLFNTNIEDNENSDGIIVNIKGEVIGLITRNLKDELNKDLSTVIGISKIKPIITRICNMTPRVFFGIKADDLTVAAKQEHSISNGIYVNEVQADSPAFEGGMKSGDIILKLNGQTILNTNNFYNTISNFQPGTDITVEIKRTTGTSEREMSLTVTLAEKVQ
jgi:S1-C subfamily serine protease